ncbi:MAG TPA: sulfate adenylyltransferase subunit CysN [Pseudolabrys sp.]|nr:sulfate adenylyltransferase subunit CysN [Pseudolabrys sp.]
MQKAATSGDQTAAQADRGLLKFLTCGSVDDGKSTLIGRLLYDCKLIYDDQMAALENDSARFGTVGDKLDMALLVDGLQAEREQGITIDVAYRFFATERRKFVVADTPGHEQYTRNMATGASTADLAVLLVDARKGLLTQTHRHSFIVSLLGIRDVVLAVNKMDLVGWDQATFEEIAADYRELAGRIGIPNVAAIPLSALTGDNVTRPSDKMRWHKGPTLLAHLETVDVASDRAAQPFRLPVQWVNRPNADFRGYCGTIASGRIKPKDRVVVLPSGQTTQVKSIVTMDGELPEAVAGRAVTLTLTDEIDASRGDIVAAETERPVLADQFAAHVVWMNDAQMLPGRSYLLSLGGNLVNAQVTNLKHKINVNTLEHTAAKHLDLNEIGEVNIALDRAVAFDPYSENRDTGGFILIDRLTNATVGCGMIQFALRRATNVHWQATKIDKAARAGLKHQKPCVLWFTGLSGAGKSTVADLVEQSLTRAGRHTIILDGDNVRHGLNKDLGFTDEDRVENIRRVAEVAKLMVQAGLIVLVSFISPFRSERRMAREMVEADEFLEIHIDTPLEVCEARDPKGLYKLARAGKLPNLTGIGSAYEKPEHAELVLTADGTKTPEALADDVLALLKSRSII